MPPLAEVPRYLAQAKTAPRYKGNSVYTDEHKTHYQLAPLTDELVGINFDSEAIARRVKPTWLQCMEHLKEVNKDNPGLKQEILELFSDGDLTLERILKNPLILPIEKIGKAIEKLSPDDQDLLLTLLSRRASFELHLFNQQQALKEWKPEEIEETTA